MAERRLAEVPGTATWPVQPVWDEARVVENVHTSDRYWRLRLAAPDVADRTRPGQFVMLTVARPDENGPVLPRPMAVYDAYHAEPGGTIDVVYGVVGYGTHRLAGFRPGERLLTVGPLGRGFHLPAGARRLLLLGRGIGTCSLTLLAARAVAAGLEVTAVASGRHAGAVVGADLYRRCGVRTFAVHDGDGSSDVRALDGRLTRYLGGRPPDLIATCGSRRLHRLASELGGRWGAEVQVALEAHMACGLGYCHGCSTGARTATAEAPLVCRDGPVFRLAS